MNLIKETQTLQSKAKTNKNKYWKARVVEENDNYYIVKEYWQEGSKHQSSEPFLVEPKNIGKKNETSVKEQALLELERIFKKQQDSGYSLDGVSTTLPLPMLAKKWFERKHNIKYPCVVQPKFDGIRCLYKHDTGFWSRKGKLLIPEVTKHLEFKHNYILDGELMLDGASLQKSIKLIKKYRQGESEKLKYYVYDIIDEQLTFHQRMNVIDQLSKFFPSHVKAVKNTLATDEKNVYKLHKEMIKEYEGTIIRNLDSMYLINHRSENLLKLKDFFDAEFEIIGSYEGGGRNKGCITFECITESGEKFGVNPEGTIEERKEMWDNRDSYIGKMLTVRYPELTDRGVPKHHTGVAIRDYE